MPLTGIESDVLYKKYSYENGFPSATVFDLHVGADNYLYLGSTEGLIKFNGVSFKVLPFSSTISSSISDIIESENGTLFCRNFSNQVFKVEKDVLKPIEGITDITRYDNIRAIAISENTLWIATTQKVFSLNEKNQTELKFMLNTTSHDEEILDICFNKEKDEIAILSTEKLYRLSEQNFTSSIVKNGNKRLISHNGNYYYSLKSKYNEVWDAGSRRKFEINIDKNIVFNRLSSTKEKLWLCTSNGLFLLDEKEQTLKSALIKSGRISDIVLDHEGNYWVSTLDNGIYFIPNIDIKLFKFSGQNSSDLAYNHVSLSTLNNGKIITGTSNGMIFEFDTTGRLINKFNSSQSYPIEYIYYDSTENRIITSQGIFGRNGKVILEDIYLGKNIYPDDRGNFILTTFNKAVLVNQDFRSAPNFTGKDKSGFYSTYEIPSIFLYDQRTIASIYCKQTQTYYISSATEGLLSMDTAGNYAQIKLNDSIPIAVTRFLKVKNDIWAISSNLGLLKISKGKIVKQYNEEKGLSSNNVRSFTYANNCFWLISSKGINQVNLETDEILDLAPSFYLNNFSISDIAATENHLWLSSNIGILRIPFKILKPVFDPKLFFKDVLVNKVSSKEKRLDYTKNNITFLFDAILFQSMGLHYFEYRLLGYDDQWVKKSAVENRIDFINIEQGNYVLQLKVIFGTYHSKIIEYPFTILKPFWLKAWFMLTVFMLFLVILFFVYQLAKQRAKKEELIHRRLALSQLTALRAQMNPHFMFNVLNSVQGLIYSNQKSKASDYLGKFSTLMRQIINLSEKLVVDLKDEIDTLRLYIELESERFEQNEFEYTLKIDERIYQNDLKIPSMIIQPYIENAIKHGLLHKKGSKKLQVTFDLSKSGSYLLIGIEDNGIGREASMKINKIKQKHASFATKAIDKKIELLNQQMHHPIELKIKDYTLKNDLKTGTKVTIKIPFINE